MEAASERQINLSFVRPDGLTYAQPAGRRRLSIMRNKACPMMSISFIYLGTAEHENHAVSYTRRDLG